MKIKGLYNREAFHHRLVNTLKNLKVNPKLSNIKNKDLTTQTAIAILRQLNVVEPQLYKDIIDILMKNSDVIPYLLSIMMIYLQVDYMIHNIKE